MKFFFIFNNNYQNLLSIKCYVLQRLHYTAKLKFHFLEIYLAKCITE